MSPEALAQEDRNDGYKGYSDCGCMCIQVWMAKHTQNVQMGGLMWYVMQVAAGRESQTVVMLERVLTSDVLENCFIPMRRLKKKFHGRWQEIAQKLFPGYVFLISEKPQLLYDELKKIPALTKLLGSCEEYFTPLSESDVQLLKKLQNIDDMVQSGNGLGPQNIWEKQNKSNNRNEIESLRSAGDNGKYLSYQDTSIVGLSKVIVEEDRKIRIVSGPLKNLEGQIRKINLHKRIVVVEAEFMGNRSLIHLGIEIMDENL